MDIVFGGNISQTWRSIMYGLELLKKGIIQRIGGALRYSGDNWIPREISLKVVTRCGRPRIRWVSDLLDNEFRELNCSLVRATFLPIDADAILKLRIPFKEILDQSAWHYEKTGFLSASSAYKLTLKLQCQDQVA
ncbi:hypothetical protein PVAP13_6NG214003 [Panicum virgatum]|uniref:Uncharacterized protein n=1 Tax=Panicum virgatum TaxID=38727 RepID=A0A8T0QZZ9_PANVG|nr:hypothetical protein PVAP13_6NG214003 [Panicum virgatum]